MKHWSSLILKSLKGQPKRAALTGISIALAVALMAAVSTLAASAQQTQINQAVEVTGNFHGTFNRLSGEQVERLKQTPAVQAVGLSAPVGSFMVGSTIVSLEGYDGTARDLMQLEIQAGRFPQAADEIALESWMLEELDPQPALGDTLTLRWLVGAESGTTISGDFKLVGILENIPQAQMVGVSLGLVALDGATAFTDPEDIPYTAFVAVQGDAEQIRGTLEYLRQTLGVDEKMASVNETLLAALGTTQEVRLALALLAGLLVTAAAATIYNIFQISVVERIRQFGMLRAVGATPGQVCLLVLGEALFMSLAAVPVGLAAGVGAANGLAQGLAMLKNLVSELVVPGWALAVRPGPGWRRHCSLPCCRPFTLDGSRQWQRCEPLKADASAVEKGAERSPPGRKEPGRY